MGTNWHRSSPDQEEAGVHHGEQHVEANGAVLMPVEGRIDPPLPARKVDPDEKEVHRPIPDANLNVQFRRLRAVAASVQAEQPG